MLTRTEASTPWLHGDFVSTAVTGMTVVLKYVILSWLSTDVVSEGHRRPEFTQTLSRTIVVEGGTAKFECKVSGNPQPEIQWWESAGLACSALYCVVNQTINMSIKHITRIILTKSHCLYVYIFCFPSFMQCSLNHVARLYTVLNPDA